MSHDWEVIVPAALVAMGTLVVWARRLRHPPGGHRADRGRVDDGMCKERSCPNFGGVWHDCPQFKEPVRYGSMILAEEATLRRHLRLVDGYDAAWPAAGLAALHETNDLGPGAGLTDTGYNSHLLSEPKIVKVDSPALVDLPREDGAGDESEGSGLTAPPAPLWEYRAQNPDLAGEVVQLPLRPVDLALARCDLFMAAMRADHERWLSGARERWAA